MATQLFTYSLYSGDIIPLTLNFYQSDGKTPLDLTNITIGTTVKNHPTDTDANSLFWQDIPGTTSGIISYNIPGLNAGTFWIDVKWWNVAQNNLRQTVIGATQFTVQQSITARATPGSVNVTLSGLPLPKAA
jgi:hypothetical protein